MPSLYTSLSIYNSINESSDLQSNEPVTLPIEAFPREKHLILHCFLLSKQFFHCTRPYFFFCLLFSFVCFVFTFWRTFCQEALLKHFWKVGAEKNIQNWKGPMRITDFNSWLHTDLLVWLHHKSKSIFQTLLELYCLLYCPGEPALVPKGYTYFYHIGYIYPKSPVPTLTDGISKSPRNFLVASVKMQCHY